MVDQDVEIGSIFKVSTFSFSVLKFNTGNKEPWMVFVLSMFIVRFSENSICE